MSTICKKCNSTNDKDAAFCAGCGAKLPETSRPKKYLKYLMPIILILVIGGGVEWYFISQNQPPNYFPLTAGMEWDYQLTGGYVSGVDVSRAVVTNLPPQEMDGRQVIPQKWNFYATPDATAPVSNSFEYFYADKDGTYYYAQENDNETTPRIFGANNIVLRNPLRSGESWGGGKYAVDSVKSTTETITVPAGTFQNVIDISDDSGGEDWYAPNVGRIMEVVTNANGKIVMKLTNFKN